MSVERAMCRLGWRGERPPERSRNGADDDGPEGRLAAASEAAEAAIRRAEEANAEAVRRLDSLPSWEDLFASPARREE